MKYIKYNQLFNSNTVSLQTFQKCHFIPKPEIY